MISTHAPAGGATLAHRARKRRTRLFLLTPLREGRRRQAGGAEGGVNFYSRPCGRGDQRGGAWLLPIGYFYSRPCGRGDLSFPQAGGRKIVFLLTPLREGRHSTLVEKKRNINFYSRPCGRGDQERRVKAFLDACISTHAPAGGATKEDYKMVTIYKISTHAPAGGATRGYAQGHGQD